MAWPSNPRTCACQPPCPSTPGPRSTRLPSRFCACIRLTCACGLPFLALCLQRLAQPRPELHHLRLPGVVFGASATLWGLCSARCRWRGQQVPRPYSGAGSAKPFCWCWSILFIQKRRSTFRAEGRAVEADPRSSAGGPGRSRLGSFRHIWLFASKSPRSPSSIGSPPSSPFYVATSMVRLCGELSFLRPAWRFRSTLWATAASSRSARSVLALGCYAMCMYLRRQIGRAASIPHPDPARSWCS